MIVGSIKHCPNCDENSYVRTGELECPNCKKEFTSYPISKAPEGWVKLENYEISRRSVEKMLKSGELSMEDLRR